MNSILVERMEDFRECPFYKDEERRDAAWERDVEKAKAEIVDQMRALGLVPEMVMMLIENAAEVWVELKDARREARRYPRVQVKTSREGNDTLVSNPIYDKVRELSATFGALMKDLGFGAKTEKVVTNVGTAANQESGDDGAPTDPAGDFVRKTLESLK